MGRNRLLAMAAVAVLATTLTSCTLFPPSLISEDEIPASVEATEITPNSLDWEGYFVPDCPQIVGFAAELRQTADFVEGVSFTAPSLTAWKLDHIIFEAENSEAAEDLALGFAVARACIGVPAAVVAPIPVSSSFDTDLEGTAFSQVIDLAFLGTIEGVKTMVSSGRYLIYIDTYGHEFSGFDLPKLYQLTSRALR